MAMAVVITATRNVRAGTPRSCAGTCVVGQIIFAAGRQARRRQSPTLSNYTDAPASAWQAHASVIATECREDMSSTASGPWLHEQKRDASWASTSALGVKGTL